MVKKHTRGNQDQHQQGQANTAASGQRDGDQIAPKQMEYSPEKGHRSIRQELYYAHFSLFPFLYSLWAKNLAARRAVVLVF